MATKDMADKHSFSEHKTPNCRCSICGRKMKMRQEILIIDTKQYCAACYHDKFFANARSSHRLTLDRYDG